MVPGKIHHPLVQVLLEEHAVIQQALTVLSVLTGRVKRRRPVALADLVLLVRFFQNYADKIHHRTEEDQLFVAVERNRILRRMNQRLLSQHTMGRVFVDAMADSLKSARSGRRGWRTQFVDNASAYCTLLHIHICDENHVYFPRAEKILRKLGSRTELPVAQASTRRRYHLQLEGLYRRSISGNRRGVGCHSQRCMEVINS